MTRVAVLDDYQRVAARLGDWGSLPAGTEVIFVAEHDASENDVVKRLEAFEVVVAMRERTPFPHQVLSRLPALRLLVTTGMRNAAIDLGAASELGVVVSGTRSGGTDTAELTWGLILALARRIPAEDRSIREGGWQSTLGISLEGKTLGVLGLGRLGSRVAKVGLALGMEVVAWSQNLTERTAAEVGVRRVERDQLFATSDVLTVHLVLSDRTRGLVGARELGLMKPTAFLVNAARGPIVDRAALIECLRAGHIAGAGLDVYDLEPLPLDDPLRTLPNTVLTPHLGYVTESAYSIFYGDAVEDIAQFLAGKPLRVLNPPPS